MFKVAILGSVAVLASGTAHSNSGSTSLQNLKVVPSSGVPTPDSTVGISELLSVGSINAWTEQQSEHSPGESFPSEVSVTYRSGEVFEASSSRPENSQSDIGETDVKKGSSEGSSPEEVISSDIESPKDEDGSNQGDDSTMDEDINLSEEILSKSIHHGTDSILHDDDNLEDPPAPHHVCHWFKHMPIRRPDDLSDSEWIKTIHDRINHLNIWIKNWPYHPPCPLRPSSLPFNPFSPDTIIYADYKDQLDQIGRMYLSEFVMKLDEFIALSDDKVSTKSDLFYYEWIQWRREVDESDNAIQLIDQNKMPLGVVPFVVLPVYRIALLINEVSWCRKMNLIELELSDKENLPFVNYDLNRRVEVRMKFPAPLTKSLVKRFYDWLLDYADKLIDRIEERRNSGELVVPRILTIPRIAHIITGQDVDSDFITNQKYLQSKLYKALMGLWGGVLGSGNANQLLREAKFDVGRRIGMPELMIRTKFEFPFEDKNYENCLGKAVYLYVVETLGIDANQPHKVPENYFRANVSASQFIGIMQKFKDVVKGSQQRMLAAMDGEYHPDQSRPGFSKSIDTRLREGAQAEIVKAIDELGGYYAVEN